MFHTDGQHNNSHFSNGDNGAQIRANYLKPRSMVSGSGDWEPSFATAMASSVNSPHPTTSQYLLCLGRRPVLPWKFSPAGSGIVHPTTSTTAALLLWEASEGAHLVSPQVSCWEGGKRSVRNQEGWEMADGQHVSAEGFATSYGSLGSSWAGFLCVGPVLQPKQAWWRRGWMQDPEGREAAGKLVGDGRAQAKPLPGGGGPGSNCKALSHAQSSSKVGMCFR